MGFADKVAAETGRRKLNDDEVKLRRLAVAVVGILSTVENSPNAAHKELIRESQLNMDQIIRELDEMEIK